MMNLLFNIFIFPIEQILSLFFVVAYRIFLNPGMSLLSVSLIFSIVTLPLYFLAEKYQEAERDIQARMKSEIDNIHSAFSGNERFMRLAVYYRHNGYHPVYSMRSSISLLIQVPFFIAAYHFLSNLESIRGVSFGPIGDLARPDSMLSIGNFTINLLPVIMTAINLAASAIYTKGFSKRDKIQLYGIALIFLVLLYNSPSGLVIYWTCNNIFSLVKNIIQKSKHSKIILVILVSVLCLLMSVYLLAFHRGEIFNRLFAALLLISVPFIMLFFQFFIKTKNFPANYNKKKNSLEDINIFLLSITVIFLLGGLVIPSFLISSSAQEFSFIENNKSPIPFIINVLSQSFGLFILLPLCIYFLLSKNGKKIVAKVIFILSVIFVVNALVFPGDYGPLSVLITFNQQIVSAKETVLINLIAITAVAILFIYIYRYRKIITSILFILVCSFIAIGVINCVNIIKVFNTLQIQYEKEATIDYHNIYKLSKNGKNVILIFIDGAISGYIPYVFNEKPELYESFEGFTWYKDTISFGSHTVFGAPGIYGGYEYTPSEMQARDNVPLVEKHDEALLLLPKLLLGKGFKVTVTDPPYANYNEIPDLSIFKDYPDIYAYNIIGKFTKEWLANINYKIELTNITDSINKYLIWFSIFRFTPMALRNFVYDNGRWFAIREIKYSMMILDNYIALDILKNITEILDSDENTYNSIYNLLSHERAILRYPDYTLSNQIGDDRNNNLFVDEDLYDANMASFILLGKWFDFLKRQNVYDNTKIIIVSDHGNALHDLDDVVFPGGSSFWRYPALLMMKDFNSQGRLLTDNTFMTNADVPLLVLKDIIDNPINPWTGKPLITDKTEGVDITTSQSWHIQNQFKNKYNIKSNEWIHIKDDIYDLKNWSWIKK